jgi:hypothetical protein
LEAAVVVVIIMELMELHFLALVEAQEEEPGLTQALLV